MGVHIIPVGNVLNSSELAKINNTQSFVQT